MGITYRSEAMRTRSLLQQAASLLSTCETLPVESRDCVVETLEAVLASKPGDRLRDVVDVGPPFQKSKDHAGAAEFSRRYRELRRNSSMKHADIINEAATVMNLSRRTAERYWHRFAWFDVYLEDNHPDQVAAWKEKYANK